MQLQLRSNVLGQQSRYEIKTQFRKETEQLSQLIISDKSTKNDLFAININEPALKEKKGASYDRFVLKKEEEKLGVKYEEITTSIVMIENEVGKYKIMLTVQVFFQYLQNFIPDLLESSINFAGFDRSFQQSFNLPIARKKFCTKMEEMKDGKKEEDTWTLVFNKVFSEYFDRAPEEPDVPLMQLGADSLVLAEISRALSHELQIQISVLDIFTQASFNKLYKHISTALTNSITISEN